MGDPSIAPLSAAKRRSKLASSHVDPKLPPLREDLFLRVEAHVTEELLARRVVEDLGRDDPDPVPVGLGGVLPHVDEHDFEHAGVLHPELFKDRRHLLAGDALVRPEVHELRQGLRRGGRLDGRRCGDGGFGLLGADSLCPRRLPKRRFGKGLRRCQDRADRGLGFTRRDSPGGLPYLGGRPRL